MAANRVGHVARSLLVVTVLVFACSCSAAESPQSSSAVQSLGVSAPTDEEIAAAVKELFPDRYGDYELSPKEEDRIRTGTIVIAAVEQDANNRWVATLRLVPAPIYSTWPMKVVVARDSNGWQVVSEESDTTRSTVAP